MQRRKFDDITLRYSMLLIRDAPFDFKGEKGVVLKKEYDSLAGENKQT